jgi:hypothetical protein
MVTVGIMDICSGQPFWPQDCLISRSASGIGSGGKPSCFDPRGE